MSEIKHENGEQGVDILTPPTVPLKKSNARKKKGSKRAGKTSEPPTSGPGSGHAAKFPRHSLEKALRIPAAILKENAGNESTKKQIATFLGVSVTGEFGVLLSSASKYGLIGSAGGMYALTPLARTILRPQNSEEELKGLRDAVMIAPDISKVYLHYRGENLPSPTFFDNALQDTFAIPSDKLEAFKEVLRDTLKKAELLDEHDGIFRIIDCTKGAGTPSTEKSETLRQLGRQTKIETGDTCFVVMPFAPPIGTYYDQVYKPAIEKAGLKSVRADSDIFGAGKIIDQVLAGITHAKVLVAELTTRNPNVFYELGIAHALKKPVVLVSANEDDVPFDVRHIRVIYYDKNDPFWGAKLIDKVAENILSAINNPEEAIFKVSLG